MNANDLKVGDFVLYKGEVVQVTIVGEFGIQARVEDTIIYAKFFTPDIQPIPLTQQVRNNATQNPSLTS